MWPFTKKTEENKEEKKEVKKIVNKTLEYVRDNIAKERSEFLANLARVNLTEDDISLHFVSTDKNSEYGICEVTALIKSNSQILGDYLQKIISHKNFDLHSVDGAKMWKWMSWYNVLKIIMNNGEYGIGIDKQWFKLTIETNQISDVTDLTEGMARFTRMLICEMKDHKDIDFYNEMVSLHFDDNIKVGSDELYMTLNPVKAAEYLTAVKIKYAKEDKKYLDLYEDHIAELFAYKLRHENKDSYYKHVCTTRVPEVSFYRKDLFLNRYKEITEEEARQKICGEFVKKVNNMI